MQVVSLHGNSSERKSKGENQAHSLKPTPFKPKNMLRSATQLLKNLRKYFIMTTCRVACCNIQAAISVRAAAHDIALLRDSDRVGPACLMVFHYRISCRVLFSRHYNHKLRVAVLQLWYSCFISFEGFISILTEEYSRHKWMIANYFILVSVWRNINIKYTGDVHTPSCLIRLPEPHFRNTQ